MGSSLKCGKRLCAMLCAPLLLAVTMSPTLAAAQYYAGETPGAALSRHVRILASEPRNFAALIGAGRAALDVGDLNAAIGFFGRAQEANANAPDPLIGLGAAALQMDDVPGALDYFGQAARLGATPQALSLDRGMARDLVGDLPGAQSDYRLALNGASSDEARRRLALSLAIGRDKAGALATLQPLLQRRDVAAQRTRAFCLALTGDVIGAATAIEAVMPGGSARFAPFFRYLPNLSTIEKAKAVHLGLFPEDAATRVAAVSVTGPRPVTDPPRVAVNTTPTLSSRGRAQTPARKPAPAVTRPSSDGESTRRTLDQQLTERALASPRRTPARAKPVAQPPSASSTSAPVIAAPVRPSSPPAAIVPPAATFALPSQSEPSASSFTLPSQAAAEPVAAISEPAGTTAEPLVPVATAASAPTEPSPAAEAPLDGEQRLSGIDTLLASLPETPPPVAKVAVRSTGKVDARKAADRKKADEVAKAKAAAEKKKKEEAARLGTPGTYWVQLAGGTNKDRMPTEYKRLAAKAGTLLKRRSGYVTIGKDYFRLLVGPFDSREESVEFNRKLDKQGVDGFSWTRTPAQLKIEKLPSS
jgi:tetratricopeptide (TPR) repeat protein